MAARAPHAPSRARSSPSSDVERSLRRILLAALAAPLAAAGCTSSAASSANTEPDSSTGGHQPQPDASEPFDASDASSPVGDSAPSGPCAAVLIDGSAYDEASAPGCARFAMLPCGLPAEASVESCSLDPVTCKDSCLTNILFGCNLASGSCVDGGAAAGGGPIIVDCVVCPGTVGRRPRGLRAQGKAAAVAPLGEYFAEMAHLEAASIVAFRDLAASLAALGAPRALRRAADRAAQDERRHAAVTGRFARRFGGTPRRPCVASTSPPTLEELLADNAVEGCVGESYGALVAMWQAERARDPGVARAMRRIARDEASHAVLAWRVLRWGAPLLDEHGRRRVRARVDRTLELLRASAEASVDPSVIDQAGHPSPDAARALAGPFAQFVREHSDAALRAGSS